ncbi:hypothetical protein ACIRD8_37830, partial [Streptomyces sp. NPDC102451]|uniref:hypothetical protein n=1 Tax=Streptomyces sp. NPDC102451 TaxID=3366177 RepID=UPI00380A7827
ELLATSHGRPLPPAGRHATCRSGVGIEGVTSKNTATHQRYKFVVRVLKNVENDLTAQGVIEALPSYFSECLIYNVPNPVFLNGDLDDAVSASLAEVYRQLDSATERQLMQEPNEIKMLFGSEQKWREQDALDLILHGWRYLNYGG